MTKKEAGQKGGRNTASKYGSEYMRKLGAKGALAFHAKYKLEPLGQNDFAIVDRQTGIPTGKTINGKVFL